MAGEINLNHICKIEGHAHLTLKIEKNKVSVCELKAAEGARFFEALVLGKKIQDIQEIVSRICGICSCAHSVSSIQALEEALNIHPSEQQKAIRELLMIGERIRSSITHLYFMSLPDYLGYKSALSMSPTHKEKISDALALISLGNKIIEALGGREMHPFLEINKKLREIDKDKLIKEIENSKKLFIKTINLFFSLNHPKIERNTDYLSLKDKTYAIISGKIKSNSGLIDDNNYKKHLKENIKEYSTSKFVLKDEKPFVTGASARINNNSDQLDIETKKYLRKNKLSQNNPFFNNLAQAIELLHLANRAVKLIENLQIEKQKIQLKIKQGVGVSAVEAPRGTLFHEYKINNQGVIDYCNIITPTAQNLNSMELDIKQLANSLLLKNTSKEKIILEIEKLIRAYDPCFSCSTHFLKVKWL
ncbi:MAG: Ni/Fe hydrogenase subunit alpha [archaeon]